MTNMENKLTKKDIKDQIDMRPVVACYRTVLNRQFSKYYQRPSCEFCSKNKENCKGENDDGDIVGGGDDEADIEAMAIEMMEIEDADND